MTDEVLPWPIDLGDLGPLADDPSPERSPRLDGASMRIRLYPSGILFAPFAPDPESIRIEDVAHGLACINRFGGHLAEPYNVAHHSLIVSYLCAERPLWGLLHEIAEALSGLGDVCGPTKRHPSLRGPIKAVEHGIERAAAERFGLPFGFASAPCVKDADLLAYAWEDRDLRGGTDDDAWVAGFVARIPAERIEPMGWRAAERAFLDRFEELTGREPLRAGASPRDLGPLDGSPLDGSPRAIGMRPPDWHPRPQGCSATLLFDARLCELSGCAGPRAGRVEP